MKSYISVGLLLIASFVSVSVNAAVPENLIYRIVLNVAGSNDEWTSTNLKAMPGDILLVRAKGEVTVGAFTGKTTPNGTPSGVGLLQLKIGATNVQPVGEMRYIIATETGTVKLRVNDTKYQDNSGEYKVEVIRIPAALIPEALQVEAN